MGHLFTGLKSIKMKDSSVHRNLLFQNYIDTSFIYRLVLRNPVSHTKVYKKFISYLFSSYALLNTLKVSLEVESHHKFLVIYEHNNEIRCIGARLTKEDLKQAGFLTFEKPLNLAALKFLFTHPLLVCRLFSLNSKIIQKKGVLIGTRQAQFLCLYLMSHYFLKQNKLPLLTQIISTESNPNVIGPALAAQKLGADVIYINHGFLDADLGIFFQDKIVAQGSALLKRISSYAQKKSSFINVGAYYPISELKLPISQIKTVGIVLSLNPVQNKIDELINHILKTHPEVKIEIRPHPNLIFSSELTETLKKNDRIRVLIPSDWVNFDVQWDLAIAGNTSAHIDLIAKGIPCLGMSIDQNPDDLYGLYKNGLILNVPYHQNIHLDLNQFYNQESWRELKVAYLPDLPATIKIDTHCPTA